MEIQFLCEFRGRVDVEFGNDFGKFNYKKHISLLPSMFFVLKTDRNGKELRGTEEETENGGTVDQAH